MDNKTKAFEKKYRAKVEPSRDTYYAIKHYVYTINDIEPRAVTKDFGVQITMSPDDFSMLLEDMGRIDYLNDQIMNANEELSYRHYERKKEEALREEYPTLQKAYERYRMVLDMVSGRKNGESS